ncbi:hypothetical protein [Bradyrhizobium sp. SYSU BS000235]|uniref:hypothetical protein n=1 Tax=Bradyrhizobium sp. SYSU BS000235 TaxID=3411332 RepID=UPI003C71053C
MRDTTKGLRSLLAGLDTQKSRGWIAHNEFDYFTLCATCGHWFDCRNQDSLIRHKHATTTASIVVTTITTSARKPIPQGQGSSPTTAEVPDLPPKTPAGEAKT